MIRIDHPSPNFDDRDGLPDLIVLHYTGMIDGQSALRRLCDPAPVLGNYLRASPLLAAQSPDTSPDTPLGRVSSHYLVETDGRVFALVAEDKRAWHAGVSHWAGTDGVNARSIGIEIVNGGHDFGLPPYPRPQIAAVIALVADIRQRWSIPPARVVGHSDIAPGRKLDPGEHFPWEQLAEAGQALAVSGHAKAGDPDTVSSVRADLAAIGYGVPAEASQEALTAVLDAFQRRFRPTGVTGTLDAETRALIADIASQCRAG